MSINYEKRENACFLYIMLYYCAWARWIFGTILILDFSSDQLYKVFYLILFEKIENFPKGQVLRGPFLCLVLTPNPVFKHSNVT